jgi:peptidyl-prolyl cis-trans isomerase D
MTMLDRMRRHRNWLKWSLGLVCLAFVIFYIPDFLRTPTTDLAATDTIAIVEGQEISGSEFRRTYEAQMQAYRSQFGGQMNEQLLKQLGVDQQILQQMVDERAALAEATRLGLTVDNEEVKQRILSYPAFQESGAFIGEQRYRQLLGMQRPPLSTQEFEEGIRRSLLVDKLQKSITEWLSVTDKELESEYRRRNDKVKLAVVTFPVDSFLPDVSATDADIAAHFEAKKEDFRVPEKRKLRYVLVDTQEMRAKVVVPQADVERAYNENFDQYSSPEQVRASHVLFRTEGKEEAAVRAQAEAVLKEARGGADFAALAQKYSQDESNAKNGGDLGAFGRGRMVPEFDAIAFALEAGQISDVVKTEYGFHIIKLTEKVAGAVKPIDEVRAQLTEQIAMERAETQAATLADTLAKQVSRPTDLDNAAKTLGLTVQDSGFFSREEPILGLGMAPEVTGRVFSLAQEQVTGVLPTSRGFVVGALVAKQEPYVPKLDEVKEKVRQVVVREKARDMARQRATELAAKVKGAADFERAAKAAGAEPQTTELITRDSPIPNLGVAPAVIDAAFALPAGGVSDAIATDAGAAVIKVVEKQEVTPTEVMSNKDRFREELLADRRNRFFSAYMVKAKQKMKIEVNREALQRVNGT